MYDWSEKADRQLERIKEFQLLLKGCTIEAKILCDIRDRLKKFQLLLKGCTIEASHE